MKWEYLVRETSSSGEIHRFQEQLCELGEKSWELVTVNLLPNDLYCRLIFKRPILEKSAYGYPQ